MVGWLQRRVDDAIKRLAANGSIRVYIDRPHDVPCAACGGTGRTEPVHYENMRASGGGGDFEQRVIERLAKMAQGICLACDGTGVKRIKENGSL
jgi:DnaJ-class molecular chaperone